MNTIPDDLKYEDAMRLLIGFLRNPETGMFGSYGYDVYLPALVITYLRNNGREAVAESIWTRWSPVFYEVGWELCRRGILRPGVSQNSKQATDDGNAGNGYSITAFGRQWLKEAEKDSFVPTEPERFGNLLAKYREKFGDAYQERGQEAVRCYGAHAYLACCVMCGAAAESIILAAAIKKQANEEMILKVYEARSGRRDIENILFGKSQLRDEYHSYTRLLKYWRDYAAHGKLSNIREEESFTSLAMLLRFAMFMNDNWLPITERE